MTTQPVLGVDACKLGWVGIQLDGAGSFAQAYVAPTITDLERQLPGEIVVIAIDIPMGLSDATMRRSDPLAQARLGRLRASIFVTPVRTALEADTYPEALAINRAATGGVGFSIQAWGLRTKLLEVRGWLATPRTTTAYEVHPEVSFAAMNGGPLEFGKRTWAGLNTRRRLLREVGIDVPDELGPADRVGIDDVLDAAATAWTARRIVRGEAVSLPDVPEVFSDGIPAAIWF